MPDYSLAEITPFAENMEPRCACVLVLDTSGSMAGEPIQRLNQGIQLLKDTLIEDALACRRVEIAVVTFDSQVSVLCDFVTADDFYPPILSAQGLTQMGGGLITALDLVEARKQVYKRAGISYYRPWVFMITDGEPAGEPPQVTEEASRRVQDAESASKAAVFAIGVEGANIGRLHNIVVREPLKLSGLDFASLFTWLSASMSKVSQSTPGDQLALPPPGWASI